MGCSLADWHAQEAIPSVTMRQASMVFLAAQISMGFPVRNSQAVVSGL